MYWSATGDSELLELDSTGMPLGCDETGMEEPAAETLTLQVGGMLYVFSDGIFEAPNDKHEMFETDRTKAIFNRMRSAPAREIVEAVRKEVHHWQGRPTPADDQTIVIVRRIPDAAATSSDSSTEQTSDDLPSTAAIAPVPA